MKTEKLIQFAATQTAIIVAVLLSIPITGGLAILLLHTLAEFLCAQLDATMILTTVAITVLLITRQARRIESGE